MGLKEEQPLFFVVGTHPSVCYVSVWIDSGSINIIRNAFQTMYRKKQNKKTKMTPLEQKFLSVFSVENAKFQTGKEIVDFVD